MPLRIIATLILTLFCAVGIVQAQEQNDGIVNAQGYLSVDVLQPGSTFKLAVLLNIKEGYHIGAAVPEALWPAKLEITTPTDITFDSPQFPKEVVKAFAFAPGEPIPVYEGKITVIVDGRVGENAAPGERNISAVFAYQACTDNECLPPERVTVSIPAAVAKGGETVSEINSEIFGKAAAADATSDPGAPTGSRDLASVFRKGALLGFLILFGMGLLLSFTPCVYPMIPVTVGYFGMQTEQKTSRLMLLAGLYVLGLALTYSMLGLVAARTGSMFGSVLQNPLVPLAIAFVLVVLALSMFGLYELRVPASIAARSQDRKGPVGALLMGLLFGIVAAPCVGPFTLGLLLYVAKVGNPVFGFFAFFTTALGLGVPFFFLAAFSGSINRLPSAGMWMLSVRKIFGLLLLGAAIYHVTPLIGAHISRRIADAALPAFIVFSGVYIGWIDSALGKGRTARIIRQFVGLGIIALGTSLIVAQAQPRSPMVFEPYSEAAVARAAADGLPVMIDFSAEWCAACKELEHKTFPDPMVKAEGERFVRLRADQTQISSTDVRARQEKYAVRGLPTIVFLDSSSKEVESARIIGFTDAKQLLSSMRSVR
ncbi:MAG: thioredoxin family protein [Armatimonadetes bacterium]|nr:thioredoxin family protein [Armatimonadota bacterium]